MTFFTRTKFSKKKKDKYFQDKYGMRDKYGMFFSNVISRCYFYFVAG